MDEPEKNLLIRICAERDALFVPLRDPRAAHWSAVWEMRRTCRATGLPWRSNERSGSAASKAAERSLRALERSGLLVRLAPRASKTLNIRLSDEGDETARELTGRETVSDAIETIREIDRLTKTRPYRELKWRGIGLLPEIALNEGRGWGDGNSAELIGVEDRVLPALSRGWAVSNCDSVGHVYYMLTDAGRTAIKTFRPRPPVEREQPLEDGIELYRSFMGDALQQLRSLFGDDRQELSELPLPCSFA